MSPRPVFLALFLWYTSGIALAADTLKPDFSYHSRLNLCEPHARVAFPVHIKKPETLLVDELIALQIERYLVDGKEAEPDTRGKPEYHVQTFVFQPGTFIYQVSLYDWMFMISDPERGIIPATFPIPDAGTLTIFYRVLTVDGNTSNSSLMRLDIRVESRKVNTRRC